MTENLGEGERKAVVKGVHLGLIGAEVLFTKQNHLAPELPNLERDRSVHAYSITWVPLPWLGFHQDPSCAQPALLLQSVHPLGRACNLNFKCQMSTVTGSPGNYLARNICENNSVMF